MITALDARQIAIKARPKIEAFEKLHHHLDSLIDAEAKKGKFCLENFDQRSKTGAPLSWDEVKAHFQTLGYQVIREKDNTYTLSWEDQGQRVLDTTLIKEII